MLFAISTGTGDNLYLSVTGIISHHENIYYKHETVDMGRSIKCVGHEERKQRIRQLV
jgi:hypothetical protein